MGQWYNAGTMNIFLIVSSQFIVVSIFSTADYCYELNVKQNIPLLFIICEPSFWRILEILWVKRNTCKMLGRKYIKYCTQRSLFEILLNQTEIRLYLPCTNWFGTKRTSVWFQINKIMVNTIWFRFDLIRFLRV